jgi:hypothetical protein
LIYWTLVLLDFVCQARSYWTSANGSKNPSGAGQQFIGTHNETLSIAAMCVRNPDRSPVGINS